MLLDATPADRRRLAAEAAAIPENQPLLVAAGFAGWVSWGEQPFESEHLRRRCCRIVAVGSAGANSDLAALLRAAFATLRERGYDFVSFRSPGGDRSLLQAARDAGAEEVERLVTFERPLPERAGSLPDGVSLAEPGDAEGCAEVGRRAFRYDRFHRDARIDSRAADQLKAAWMRNSCRGRADAVLVARDAGAVVAANACLCRGDAAVIDLIGVLPEWQGRGLGRTLVDAAVAHYGGAARCLRVGTQDANKASVALYQAAGFRPVDEQATFHVHLREME